MIDIHNHSLFGVDDGAKTLEESSEMLKEAYLQGVDAMILTPHYRHGIFQYSLNRIHMNYKQLEEKAKEIGIRLYLGCEYHVDSYIVEHLQSGRCFSLAQGSYVLTEYEYETESEHILFQTKDLILHGYTPIIAHPERYRCFQENPFFCEELRNAGAMMQINAGSVLGHSGRGEKSFCKKILKNEWVDFIASDTHNLKNRRNYMAKCYQYITKRYGQEYAHLLFEANARSMIEQED